MVVKPLVVSVLALMACSVQAAGLDRSGQSILPFLQSGNYLELGVSYLSPDFVWCNLYYNRSYNVCYNSRLS